MSVESDLFGSQGEVEEELKAMDFESLYIYRPAWVFIFILLCPAIVIIICLPQVVDTQG